MIVNNAFFRLALGADVVPSLDYPALSASHKIGADLALAFPDSQVISFSRVIFSGTTGRLASFSGVDVVPTVGTVMGVAQENFFTAVAPTGVAADGRLIVGVKFKESGPQTLFFVPVFKRLHSDSAKINRAIYEVISQDPELKKYATVVWDAQFSRIKYTKVYAEAPAATSAFYIEVDDVAVTALNTIMIPGNAGMLIQRLGPVGADIYSKPQLALGPKALFLSVPAESAGSVTTSAFGELTPGSCAGKARGTGAWSPGSNNFDSVKCILDLIQIS